MVTQTDALTFAPLFRLCDHERDLSYHLKALDYSIDYSINY